MTSADPGGEGGGESENMDQAVSSTAADTLLVPKPMVARGNTSLSAATLWFALAYGGAILGYLAVNAFAARLLKDSFGYFVIAVTVSTLMGQLGLVGVHRGGLREAAKMSSEDLTGLAELRRGVRAISLIMLPVTSVLTGIGTFIFVNPSDPANRWAVAVGMAVLVWVGGQQKLLANYLRGFGQVRFASLLEGRSGGAFASVCQGVLVGAVWVFVPRLGLAGALAALALGCAIPVYFAWRRVNKLWSHVDGRGPIFEDLRRAITRNWHFASNLLGAYLNSTIELWLAGFILSRLDVSLFSASQRLSLLLSVPLASLGVVFSPVISRLAGKDDRRLEKLLRTGATYAAVLTSAAWVPMLLVPGPLLGAVYGSAFRAGAPILLLLTIGNISNVVSGLCGTALTMSRHERVVANVQWLAVGMRVVVGSAVAITFGGTGLAVSSAAISTGMYVVMWTITRRRMGLNTLLTFRPSLRLMRQTTG